MKVAFICPFIRSHTCWGNAVGGLVSGQANIIDNRLNSASHLNAFASRRASSFHLAYDYFMAPTVKFGINWIITYQLLTQQNKKRGSFSYFYHGFRFWRYRLVAVSLSISANFQQEFAAGELSSYTNGLISHCVICICDLSSFSGQ